MSTVKLSKFALEQNYPISELITFMNQNGYSKKEDTSEIISEQEMEFVKNNFNSYLNQTGIGSENDKNNFIDGITKKESVDTPVQLKVIEAANKEKLLIERIVGFTDFEWEFLIAKYNGTVSQPVPFTIFDEVICDLLLVENLSKNKLGKILGLNTVDDPAENDVIEKSLQSLRNEDMIAGDDNALSLTETGKEYAKNGVKYSFFNRDFSIYFDLTGRNILNPKVELKKLKSEKLQDEVKQVPATLEQIKQFAILQAPEVHFPDKKYLLQDASLLKAQKYKAKVWVIFLENFKDSSLRVLVFDESQGKIIDQLSEDLNKREAIKNQLFESLILASDELEITDEKKTKEQIEEEQLLIEKQTLIDSAIQSNDIHGAEKIKEEIKNQKRNFNTVEFELELKEIFDKNNNELWFISPWLKYGAIRYRINYFEKQLKQGAKIFIGYSEPERPDAVMVDPRAGELLANLEKKYSNFYIHHLPPFHIKNVWIRNTDSENTLYMGSFNILSYHVDKGSRNIRQEQMMKLQWDPETEEMHKDFLHKFGGKYITRECEKFNSLQQAVPNPITKEFLLKIKTIDHLKLNPFRNIGFEEFDSILDVLETKKTEALNVFGKQVFLEEFGNLKLNVDKLYNVKINKSTKKGYVESFENLIEEFDYLKEEFNMELSDLFQKINKLKTLN